MALSTKYVLCIYNIINITIDVHNCKFSYDHKIIVSTS